MINRLFLYGWEETLRLKRGLENLALGEYMVLGTDVVLLIAD